MLARIRRTIQALLVVYRGWRLALVMGTAIPLLALAALFPARTRLPAAILLMVALASVLVLHGLDVRRQDRLRARGGPPIEIQAIQAKAEPPRRVPGNWSPVITVVVTAHNEDEWLLQCLESVASQTWVDFECIVVDDLSTDHTLQKAVDAFEADTRFRFVYNERNLGLAGSRNVGLALARGEWITFLDGDDFLYEDALAVRAQTILGQSDDLLVAGAYCSWHSVGERTTPEPKGPAPPTNRGNVTWLDATYDTPFIASAPLIDTNAARAIGGFNASLETAEDFEFWSRFLRQGYVILWAPLTGIAYRQRRMSMYRLTAAAHATITSDVYRQNQERLPTATESLGPFLFREPAPEYHARLASARRLVTGYVAAQAAQDRQAAETIWTDLSRIAEPWMKWALGSELLANTALRLESYDPDSARARASMLEHHLKPRIQALFDRGSPQKPFEKAAMAPPAASVELSPVQLRRGSPSGWTDRPVLLMPSAAYHCDELGPLAGLLTQAGIPVRFGVIPQRFRSVETELRKYGVPVTVLEQDDSVAQSTAASVAAVVTLNDWGDYHVFVLAAKGAGVPTFGKVEGVQDFEDADVHWERRAYQQVTHVLCQGKNDFQATGGDRSMVGSTRLERIWQQPPTPEHGRTVVVNLNFTYGVLSDARDIWLDSVIAACQMAGLPWIVSPHPAQLPPKGLGNLASKPMRHLLTQPSILVSRFSTVPFEAMARGVPFVYHNPHSEQVPTFKNPEGAFEVTDSARTLARGLRNAASESDYRSRCESFFRAQIDIDGDLSSEERTFAVLADSL